MSKLLFPAVLLMAAPAFSCAADAAPAATVAIRNMQFAPATLTIAVGTRVTWINGDAAPHTVTDRNGVFRSAALDTNENYSFTFNKPGDFTYFCTIHPAMVGRITVK